MMDSMSPSFYTNPNSCGVCRCEHNDHNTVVTVRYSGEGSGKECSSKREQYIRRVGDVQKDLSVMH